MGSLPNLRTLCKDPNIVYKYELREPDEYTRTTKNPAKMRNHDHLLKTTFNSQNEISRYKITHDQNIQLAPHFLGNNYQNVRNANLQNKSQVCHHNKVRLTRSSGSQHNCNIQNGNSGFFMEDRVSQICSNSPLSSRSSRTTAISNFCSINHSSHRRRESLSSSGGASSVRRLIAVVRSTPSRLGPIYSRRVLYRNFATLCLGHATITAALFPFLSLQSSISAWWWPFGSVQKISDAGSFFLSLSFAVSSVFSLLTPCIIHVLGCNWTLDIGYIFITAFFTTHFYPTLRWLIPGYILLGISLGPIACARISYLVMLANKLTYVVTDEEEEYEQMAGFAKDKIVQKLARGLQASQDLGMVVGNAVAWFFLHYSQNTTQERDALEELFQIDANGDWICGSQSCPSFGDIYYDNMLNSTWKNDLIIVPCRTTALLASVFVGCGLVAVGLTATFTDKIRLFVYQDPSERPTGIAVIQAVMAAFKDHRLQLAAPLSIFIGLQHGFILADFSKWYVVCSLGVANVSLVFLSMGLLQSLAAFTFSLLMQNVPRYLVMATGFFFHSCLILVLLMWKPSGDDSALFYVIAAAWGVCNIIWETLNFNLLINIYPDSTWQIAFINGNFFKFLGLSLSFGLHGVICIWVKLYALAISMVVGIAPHIWLEMKLETRRKMKPGVISL